MNAKNFSRRIAGAALAAALAIGALVGVGMADQPDSSQEEARSTWSSTQGSTWS